MIRRLAVAGGLALVASLAGCSDDDGGGSAEPPDDASITEFCDAFDGLFHAVMAEAASGDSAAMVRALRDWAADIEEVGPPAGMPDDARHGFDLFVDQAGQIDENASLEDLEKLGEELSNADRAAGQAFNDWTRDNCPLDLPTPFGS